MATRGWPEPGLFWCTFWASVSKVEPYQVPSLFVWPSSWQGFQRGFFHGAGHLVTDVALAQCLYWGRKGGRGAVRPRRHSMTLRARPLAECPGFVVSPASDLQRLFLRSLCCRLASEHGVKTCS